MTPYIGNGAYCYANSASMLLASHGYQVSPGLLEVLSGVGLGAIYRRDPVEMFFSDPNGLPDAGISKALEILGFACGDWPRFNEGAEAPLDALEAALHDGPVMIGPLDMGLLRYHPHWEWVGGSDHYVLVTALDGERARLHDPDGVPCALLPRSELAEAWRAEKVMFRSGAFQAWHAPRRVREPSAADVHQRARDYFRDRCSGLGARVNDQGALWGEAAIRACGERIRGGDVPPSLHGILVHFSLRLGARRALDYASFFADFDTELAGLKREQADAFGLAHCAAVRKEWVNLADCFEHLAELEAQIKARLCD